jgi:hypothetical protein
MFASAEQLPGHRHAPESAKRTVPLRLQGVTRLPCSVRMLDAHASAQVTAPAEDDAEPLTVPVRFRRHRPALLVRYALLAVENALRTLQPFVLGGAVNGLLAGSYQGLMIFVGQHLGYLLVGSLRQIHEARFLREVTADALAQSLPETPLLDVRSATIARLVRLREAIDIEIDSAPRLLHMAFSFVGALVMLGFYDAMLAPLCLALFVPAVLLNAAYGRQSLLVNRQLEAEEKRVSVLFASGATADIRRHFQTVTHWRSKLSDLEATSFCLMELFVLGLLAAVMVHFCVNAAPRAGDVFAVFQYVLLFITALGGIPLGMHHLAQLSHRRRA